jgi:hypothetical protein
MTDAERIAALEARVVQLERELQQAVRRIIELEQRPWLSAPFGPAPNPVPYPYQPYIVPSPPQSPYKITWSPHTQSSVAFC